MLTHTENTMREVCTGPDAELVEFNGETDHVHYRFWPGYPRPQTDGPTPD